MPWVPMLSLNRKEPCNNYMSSHWKKCAFILWHQYSVLQIHHVNGRYVTAQLFHLPHMQNLFILVLVLRFSWARFENTLPSQLLPPNAVNLKFKVTNNPKQLPRLLLLHMKSSTITSKLCLYFHQQQKVALIECWVGLYPSQRLRIT